MFNSLALFKAEKEAEKKACIFIDQFLKGVHRYVLLDFYKNAVESEKKMKHQTVLRFLVPVSSEVWVSLVFLASNNTSGLFLVRFCFYRSFIRWSATALSPR